MPFDNDGKPRIEQVYAETSLENGGSTVDLILRKPITRNGVTQIAIRLTDNQRTSTDSDIPIYVSYHVTT